MMSPSKFDRQETCDYTTQHTGIQARFVEVEVNVACVPVRKARDARGNHLGGMDGRTGESLRGTPRLTRTVVELTPYAMPNAPFNHLGHEANQDEGPDRDILNIHNEVLRTGTDSGCRLLIGCLSFQLGQQLA